MKSNQAVGIEGFEVKNITLTSSVNHYNTIKDDEWLNFTKGNNVPENQPKPIPLQEINRNNSWENSSYKNHPGSGKVVNKKYRNHNDPYSSYQRKRLDPTGTYQINQPKPTFTRNDKRPSGSFENFQRNWQLTDHNSKSGYRRQNQSF